MKNKLLIIAAILALGATGVGWYAWHVTKTELAKSTIKLSKSQQNSQPFTFSLQSNHTLAINQPQLLKFTIRDQNNRVFKAFDTTNDEVLRLYVIRKDRTNFQQLHAGYDPRTGIFIASNLVLPVDGPYRLFAQFTAADAKKDTDGNKISSVSYTDITAGSLKAYMPVAPLPAKVIASADGFDTNIFFSSDDSIGPPPTSFFANDVNTLSVQINKDGMPYKNLQAYKGSISRIAAFGPNLEFSSANSTPLINNQQTGLVIFNLKFSNPGLYRLFMQTETNNQYSTFDYNVTVNAISNTKPNSIKGPTQ